MYGELRMPLYTYPYSRRPNGALDSIDVRRHRQCRRSVSAVTLLASRDTVSLRCRRIVYFVLAPLIGTNVHARDSIREWILQLRHRQGRFTLHLVDHHTDEVVCCLYIAATMGNKVIYIYIYIYINKIEREIAL